MRSWFVMFGILLANTLVYGQSILEIGPGKPYPTLAAASVDAQPGDTLLLAPGTHTGGMFIENLQGEPLAWITIRGEGTEPVTIQGGTSAVQFTDPAWLVLENLRIREQTGNGLNLDDGGTYATPAHHVVIRSCRFEDMSATGNNDLLKLSGLDSFLIQDCVFLNGAAGGSGIDMVGCHAGMIETCLFEHLGSNAIQAKGGSRDLVIRRNRFLDAGQRSLNLGGSTGAAFFRPPGATSEASHLDVYANTFIGSEAPIAYVGSQYVRVWNNTIWHPDKWVIRILQESADTSVYQAVAYGQFINNLIVVDGSVNVVVNIGPYTNPGSFSFARNLWFRTGDPGWAGPALPVAESDGILHLDPLLTDPDNANLRPLPGSPAVMQGLSQPEGPWPDIDGNPFFDPPTLGAYESGQTNDIELQDASDLWPPLFPIPASTWLCRTNPAGQDAWLVDPLGRQLMFLRKEDMYWSVGQLPSGIYGVVPLSGTGGGQTVRIVR